MNSWSQNKEGKLFKKFSFTNFRESFSFVTQVAMLAEKFNHHPEINLDYKVVTIYLISNDIQKITDRDINLSKSIDKIITKIT